MIDLVDYLGAEGRLYFSVANILDALRTNFLSLQKISKKIMIILC